MANTKIVLNRQSDLALDNALITNPQGIVLNDISGVSEAVASINSATSDAIYNEASDRLAGDLSLQNQIDFITNNTSDTALDSLTEIVAAFQAADGDLNGAITTLADAAGANLSTEVARAEAAEASLEVAKLNLAGGTMTGPIDMGANDIINVGEIMLINLNPTGGRTTIGVSSDLNLLNHSITNLPAPTADGDATNKLYVDSVASSLGSGLSSELSAEVSDRGAGDEYLQSQLDNLAQTDGLTLDVDLTNNTIKLKDTVNAPLSGIRTFEGLINVGSQPADDGAFGPLSLVTRKFVEDADASIMSIVNNVISNTTADSLDSLTEIVAAFQAADGDLNGAITNMANAATTDLNTEIAARIVAVESLDDKIEAFPLTDDLTIEVDEVDNTIKLKDTVAAPLSGIRTFEGEVDVQSVLKVAGVDVMATLSSEVSRAEEAELSLDAAKLNLAGGTMSGAIDMNNYWIDGVSNINANIVNAHYLDSNSADPIYVTSNLDFSSADKIINLPAPTNDGDATNKLYVDGVASSLGSGLSSELSAEVARAEAAEASIAEELSSEVSYLISNIDVTSIDSFSEIVRDLSSEILRADSAEASIALDFANIYAKHVVINETPNNSINSFNLATPVREDSELVYLNGLLLEGDIKIQLDQMGLGNRFCEEIFGLVFDGNYNNIGLDSAYTTEIGQIMRLNSMDEVSSSYPEYGLTWTEGEFQAKKSSVESLMNTYGITYRPLNEVDQMSHSYIFIVPANGITATIGYGDYTPNIVDGKVMSISFVEAPLIGDKVKAYGVC